MTLSTKTTLKAVSRAAPCVLCGGNHKCARGEDGLILCGRCSGPKAGFVDLGPARADPQFHLYRSENDPSILDRERTRRPVPKARFNPAVDWPALAKTSTVNLTLERADELAVQLGLPLAALDALPLIGFDAGADCWTFPEHDGKGRIIGIVTRTRDGSKRAMPGSRRGLTVPARWSERGTPLLIVEGQSDALALSLCAVSCIGRPSNCGGVDILAALLSDFPTDRPVIVMGENDRKPDGSWPGRDGAIRVASALAAKLDRRIGWTLPPDGAKDIRAWILEQKPIPNILDSWHDLGDKICPF